MNDIPTFTFANPLSNEQRYYSWEAGGMKLEYKGVILDRHTDLMGYMYLHIPINKIEKGTPVRLKVVGESASSQSWYMVFRYGCSNKVDLFAENAVIKTAEGPRQQLRFSLVYLGDPTEANIKIGSISNRKNINTGLNTLRMTVPMVDKPMQTDVSVNADGKILFQDQFTIEPTKPFNIHLLHHSHVDIGYTHVQEEVEKMQWSFLDDALEMDIRNQNYPPEAQTRWNVEVMWAVSSYLENATESKKAAFIKAVQNGTIELDALYGNELLALCNEEELYRLTEHARNIAEICGVELQSAMITDVPGWTWGIIPVLAKSGVSYFSMGTNHGHRIGDIIDEWGDRPFYWVSPSGKEKVLCWIHGKGYSLFHAGLNIRDVDYDLYETRILEYANLLNNKGFPYDIIPLRYSIGSDNGPLDLTLSDFVKDWNERYLSPKLVISTVSRTFAEFEEKYASEIPSVKGDLTAYWEDGAASSAKETAMNRTNAERLVQAQTLWSLNNYNKFAEKDFAKAWEKVMLYDEHTWGAYNSISEPESDFVKQQWEYKQSFVIDADKLSNDLIKNSVENSVLPDEAETLTIFNTNSWDRTDMIYLPPDPAYDKMVFSDSDWNKIPMQVLSDGAILLQVADVPALGMKTLTMKKGKYRHPTSLKVTGNTLENDFIKVTVDPNNGTISEIIDKESGQNLVKSTHKNGFNQYLYVQGRSPDNPLKNSNIKVGIGESGTLMASLIIESEAPGCNKLVTEIKLMDGLNRLEIVNKLDKKLIYNPEGVHFAFPFDIPQGILRIDMPFGYYQPDKDQLPGANKNYFTLRRWVDISNNDLGVTWVSPDAPLVELNEITADPIAYGWVDQVNPDGTLFSYVMNNYWETNYLAGQEGEVVFRYFVIPHAGFEASQAEIKAIEICQPLVALFTNGEIDSRDLFNIKNEEIILGSIKPVNGKDYLLRFDNISDKPKMLDLHWHNRPGHIYESNPNGNKDKTLTNYIFYPFESRFVLVEY